MATESADAIPADQVEVKAGQGMTSLILPAGEFVLEVKDATDKTLKTSRIKLHF